MVEAVITEVMERLQRARGLAWAALVPAFDHAIALAKEAEHQAAYASNEVQAGISPAYPPLVMLLAESVERQPLNEGAPF
jgi:hypothetical protein